MCCCLRLHCHINTWYQSQMKHPWCRYSKIPVDSEHEETLYQVLLCTLIIFLFIHLTLHNMLVRFAMIPAFPPLFVFIFHTSHFRTPLHTIFASFSLYFHFFWLFAMHHILFPLISFTPPMLSLPPQHPGKSLFPCYPMAMKHLSTSEMSPPWGPPEIVLQRSLHELFVQFYVSPKWQ